MSGTTDFLYNTATDLSSLYTATTDGIAQLQQLPAIKDTTSADGQEIPPMGYAAPTNQPQIAAPGANNPAGFDHALMILTNFPEMVLGSMDSIPIPAGEDKFADDVEGQLNEMGENTLASFGNGDPKLGLARVKYAVFHPQSDFPKELNAVADSIREKASNSAGYGPNEILIAVGDTATPVIYQAHLEGSLRSAGLTDAELKQVLFANDFPEATATLPPKLQNILQEAQASALKETSGELGLPSDWKIPRNTEGMKEMLSKTLDSSVNTQLNKLYNSGGVTRSEYNELRTLLALPGAETPHAAKLSPILEKLVQSAKAEIEKDYGMPENFPLEADPSGHQALLNGTYFAEFTKQLGNTSLNLTSKEQALLKEALTSEKAANALPPELKTIFENIKTTALSKVAVTYGLPADWRPDMEALSTAASRTETVGFKAAQEGLNQAVEALNTGKKILKDLQQVGDPASQHTSVLLRDYLKALSVVLITMQEILSKQSVSDTKVVDTLSIIQRDEKIGELEKRQKQLDEVLAKQKKMASLGPLKALFQWLINILMVLLLGPLGVALLVNSVARNLKENNGHLNMGKMNMVADLAKTMQDLGKAVGGPFGKVLGGLATVASLTILALLCPMALFLDMTVGEATFLKEILKGFGIPKDKVNIIAMAVQMVYQILVAVVLAVFTGGSSMALATAKIAESCGEIALKALQVVKEVFKVIQKYLGKILDMISKVLPESMQFGKVSTNTPKILQTMMKSVEDYIAKAEKHIANLQPDKLSELTKFEKAAEEAAKGEKIANLGKEAAKMGGNADEIARATKTATDAAKKAKDAQAALEAVQKPINEAADFSTNFVTTVQSTAQGSMAVVNTAVDIQNKILQAQILRIKADVESNRILVDEFIKIIKQLIDKLMETLKGISQDIKSTVEEHKKLFEGMSQVLSQLFA